MTLEEFIPNVNYISDTERFYQEVVNNIGLENLIPLLPESDKNRLSTVIGKEKNLNKIPLSNWDICAGYTELTNGNIIHLPWNGFDMLLRKIHIENVPLSQRICILKTAAQMYVEL